MAVMPGSGTARGSRSRGRDARRDAHLDGAERRGGREGEGGHGFGSVWRVRVQCPRATSATGRTRRVGAVARSDFFVARSPGRTMPPPRGATRYIRPSRQHSTAPSARALRTHARARGLARAARDVVARDVDSRREERRVRDGRDARFAFEIPSRGRPPTPRGGDDDDWVFLAFARPRASRPPGLARRVRARRASGRRRARGRGRGRPRPGGRARRPRPAPRAVSAPSSRRASNPDRRRRVVASRGGGRGRRGAVRRPGRLGRGVGRHDARDDG